jgi:hypothetical protein
MVEETRAGGDPSLLVSERSELNAYLSGVGKFGWREGWEMERRSWRKTYSIHWVDTIAVTNNNQKSSTYTPKWIELNIDKTNVPTYQLHSLFSSNVSPRGIQDGDGNQPCSRRDVIVII